MRVFVLVSLILASLGPAAEVQLSARIQHSAKFYRDRDGFMGLVAVQRDHHLIYESGYGYANVESRRPFAADTRFPIGSVSKQFTSAAILLLQQDGKLKTSDPIHLYYQNAPASWKSVTLRNLLTQTSGIPDFDWSRIHRDAPHRPEELLREILNKPLEFQPGAKYEYSNSNYLLLGQVVERVSGEHYCQFLQDRIFRPLQLSQTGCIWNAHVDHRAHGYHPSEKGPVAFEDNNLSSIVGAGSIYSSARDLIRWTEALHQGRVLSKASFAEMTTPSLNGYGYGLNIDGESAQLDIYHTGVVDGFFLCVDYIPATRTTVVVLSNLLAEGNLMTPGTLALDAELVRLGTDEDPVLQSEDREVQVPEEVLRDFAGHYRSDDPDHSVEITLTLRDGRLFIQNDGGTAVSLRAESATRFYTANQQEIEIIFDSHLTGGFVFVSYSPLGATVFKRVP